MSFSRGAQKALWKVGVTSNLAISAAGIVRSSPTRTLSTCASTLMQAWLQLASLTAHYKLSRPCSVTAFTRSRMNKWQCQSRVWLGSHRAMNLWTSKDSLAPAWMVAFYAGRQTSATRSSTLCSTTRTSITPSTMPTIKDDSLLPVLSHTSKSTMRIEWHEYSRLEIV